jgi:uncharacterized repeat protein (TIGR03837 family)
MARVWDLFCRVVDNFGDIGVCWRLGCDLADRGESVRLWVDDACALRWMATGGHEGVQVLPWAQAESDRDCGDVVIEAFGCELPQSFVSRMARPQAPVWINLEYLTAQNFAQRCHGLPSPQSLGAAAGLTKWFFHPGFVAGTGGLIRERDLELRQQAFDPTAWRAARGFALAPGERCVSLFGYGNAALPALLDVLAHAPTLLLAPPGAASDQLARHLGPSLRQGALRAIQLPWLTQSDFDRLLWSCDLNFVRGEDSWVRAQWCASPFVWQAYVQHDAAHHAKLDAFLDLYLAGAEPTLAAAIRKLWLRWNDRSAGPMDLPDLDAWRVLQRRWRATLRGQPDLTSQLLHFVRERQGLKSRALRPAQSSP